MNFPGDKHRRRMDPDKVETDIRALGDQSKRHLPTIDKTAQALWKHNLRRSREGSLMKALHSLKTHPAMTTVLGIAIVAAVLLAVPISYTRTTGYQATLEIADATSVDMDAIAQEFGKALDTEDVMVMAGFNACLVDVETGDGEKRIEIEIEDCGDYYRVRVGGDIPEGCYPGDGGTLLGTPKAESKTLGEVKKEFTE